MSSRNCSGGCGGGSRRSRAAPSPDRAARRPVDRSPRSPRPPPRRRCPSASATRSPAWPIAAERTRSWVASRVVEDGHLAALAHDQDAVAHGQHLGQVGADEDDGHALAASSSTSWWTSTLAPTSMPRVGSSRISTLRLRLQPLAEHDLLLVAARERRGRRVDRRRADAAAAGGSLGGRPLLASRSHQPEPRQKARQRGQRDVGGDRQREDQPELPRGPRCV